MKVSIPSVACIFSREDQRERKGGGGSLLSVADGIIGSLAEVQDSRSVSQLC